MAKYVVHYEMKDGTKSFGGIHSKAVECETEATAIKMVESQAKAKNPGWNFILKKVETK